MPVDNPRVYGFEMARIAEVYLSTLSALMTPLGLERNFSAFVFLCRNSGKVTQNDLAVSLKKDRVSAMRIVDYLCERDFVVRTKDQSDRRCHILEVTDKALDLLPKVEEAIRETNRILLENMNGPEQKKFAESMNKIRQKIEEMPAPEFRVQAFRKSKEEENE